MTEEEREPIGRQEWIGIGCVALLFLVLRLPLLRGDSLLLGWNSDAGIFGLMARRIHDRGAFPIFFWGQSYMGTLTSFVAAAIGFVTGNVGPLALRIAAMVEVLASIIFYWLGLRRAFDRGTALMVAAWLAAGPWYLFHFTVAPIGAEQAFFLGGLGFWFVTRTPLRSARDWFLLGLLAGFTWWINQSAIFVVAAAIVVAIARSEWWSRVKPVLRPIERFRSLPMLLQAISMLLGVFLALGILRTAGLPVPALFLHSPVGEPLTLFVLYHAVLFGRSWLDVRPARAFYPACAAFAIGFLIAYLPVIIGGLRGAYPQTYGLSAPLTTVDGLLPRITTIVRTDWWQFLGGAVAGVIVTALLAMNAVERPATRRSTPGEDAGRSTFIAGMTIILALAFFVFSSRAHEGTARYIVVALPCVYGFAAYAVSRRPIGRFALLIVLVALIAARFHDVRELSAAHREQYTDLPGDFDPRPTIAAIDRGRYAICYGDYWIAYKLQWITSERVRFIVSHGYTRNRAEREQLLAVPGPRCFVDDSGSVRVHPN
jgi:hypothetical protein